MDSPEIRFGFGFVNKKKFTRVSGNGGGGSNEFFGLFYEVVDEKTRA